MHKLGTLRGAEDVPVVYPDIWDRERTSGPDRLVIAPSRGHARLLFDLAELWACDCWLLYVLLVSRCGREAGRYQSPETVHREQLREFLDSYGGFLNSDGRHHFWVGSSDGEGTLVYDHHNVIYAYGPLESYERVLLARGFHQAQVRFPAPHTHHYHAANDAWEDRILEHWSWRLTPLRDGDRY